MTLEEIQKYYDLLASIIKMKSKKIKFLTSPGRLATVLRRSVAVDPEVRALAREDEVIALIPVDIRRSREDEDIVYFFEKISKQYLLSIWRIYVMNIE